MPHEIFYSSNKHDEVIKNIIKNKIESEKLESEQHIL
jgi:hypothetical protein